MALPEIPPLGETHSTATVLIPPGSSVLDVGCNYGAFARHLTTKGCEVTGIEIGKELAKDAADWCTKVVVGDVETLDLGDALGGETYDVITCLDVLEHLREPAATLSRLGEVLRPGGRIIISIPHVAHVAMRLQLLTGSFSYTQQGLLDRTHLRFFDRTGLEEMLADAGMWVTDRLYIRRGVTETEIELDWASISDEVLEAAKGPDSDIYQFVWSVAPIGQQVPTLGVETLWFELELARAEAGRLKTLIPADADAAPSGSDSSVGAFVGPGDVSRLQDALNRVADLEWQLEQSAQALERRDSAAARARAELEQNQTRTRAELERADAELQQARALVEETRAHARGLLEETHAHAHRQLEQTQAHAREQLAAARAELEESQASAAQQLEESRSEVARLQLDLEAERKRLSYRVSNRVIRAFRIKRKGKS